MVNDTSTHQREAATTQHAIAVTPPWHAGEVRMQQRMGVAERMAEFGAKVIRDHMPEQHRAFFEQLPFVVLGAVDLAGQPWATVLEGEPGFAQSPAPRTLLLASELRTGDPLEQQLQDGAAIGLLGIELQTRRRNRMNGTLTRSERALSIGVQQSFGNCPQYIQKRELHLVPDSTAEALPRAERLAGLDEAAQRLIRNADTFFVASVANVDAPVGGANESQRAVDVSHRGGKPGFVKVDGNVLTIPDFSGNRHFNTLGNLLVNPRAGLLFIDFETGDLLHLTGRTEIVFDGAEVDGFAGAERLWRFEVQSAVRRPRAMTLRGALREPSPKNAATGAW